MKKRLLAYLLILAMVLTLAPQPKAHAAVSSDETAHVHEHAEVNAEGTKATKKGEVLAFTSDTHNKSGNAAANRLETWIGKVEDIHGKIDVMAFGGDMAGAGASGYWDLTQADMDKVAGKNVTGVYTTGNHEISMGGDFKYSSYTSGSYSSTETKGQFEIDKETAVGSNYRIYCLGSHSSSSSYTDQVTSLTNYLSNAGNDKVIFIITHFPLHYFGGSSMGSRTTTSASNIIDVLNNAVTNNGQTIVFLWGHNHTLSDTYYDQIYGPGGVDSIQYSSSSSSTKTIKFYYGGAGCMSDSENGGGSAFVKGKGLAVAFNDSEGTMSFAYYDANGNDVTESNSIKSVTLKTVEPVPATSVTIDESTATGDDGQPVTVSQTVAKGGTLQLHVTFEPANSTSTVTWTSSNEAVATVDANGLVTGKSAGTATITATVDSAKKAVVAATLDVTVAQMYVQTNSLVAGKDYLIASGNSGDVLLLTNEETGTARQLKQAAATVSSDGKLTFDSVEEAKVLFSCVANSNSSQSGFWLTNGGQYLYADSSNGLRLVASSTQTSSSNNAKSWHYKADGKNLLWFFKDTSSSDGYTDTSQTYRYYLDYTLGDYYTDAYVGSGSSLSNTETPAVYLFVEDDGTTPEDPPAGKTVNVTPTSSNSPEESVTIAVGETLTINVTNGSSSSAYNFTATLSNSGIAQINGSTTINIAAGSTGTFTVEGLANGTVDINIANDGSYSTRKATIHLTVGDGGSTPVDPPTGETVDITPSTSNPEVSATINVDDTLIINVTNGSSREAYDFTASLSDTGIAEIQGSNPVNIAAGAIGQFTVKGLANGTVDINIQNNQSSSSYARKGTVHLTVVGSSTPVAVTGVTVTPESATVKVGKTTTLTATVAPSNATNKNVTWTSSNETIATVSGGVVTGVAAGTATITVTTEDGGFTDTCAVTVEESNDVKYELATTLEDGGEYLIVNTNSAGAAYALKNPGTNGTNIANVNYKTSVTIESGNYILTSEEDIVWTAVASGSGFHLSNGGLYLEGKSGNTGVYTTLNNADRAWTYSSSNQLQMPGGASGGQSTTYTVRYNSGSNYFQGSSATGSNDYKVYIFQRVGTDPVSGVELDKNTLNLEVGATGTLTATVLPSTAANKAVTWSSDNETVATVANGVVTAVGAGTATITVTTVDGGKTATCAVTVNPSNDVKYELVSSLEDGGEYLIVSANSGSAYALKNPGTSGTNIANSAYKTSVTIQNGEYILTSDDDIVWKAVANEGGFNLSNNGLYLEGASGNVSVVSTLQYSTRYWTYNSSNYLQHKGGSNTYTIRYSSSSSSFQGSTSNTGAVYLFKRVGTDPVASVTVAPTTLNLEVGETGNLTATVLPSSAANKSVTWSTSNPAVATVENGVVTAVGAGTAIITVTTVDGGKTDTCTVTVTAPVMVEYQLTETFEAGKKYLIATSNNGAGFILSNEDGSVSNSLKGYSVNVSGNKLSITKAVEAKTLFEAEGDDANTILLKLGSQYLYADGNGALRMVAKSTIASGKYWHYKAYDGETDKHLLWFFNGTSGDYGYTATGSYKYYLECDNAGNFTKGIADNNTAISTVNTPKIYLFVEATDTPHEHTYGTPTYQWSADNSTCTATAVCTGCTEGTEGHTVSETVTASYAVTTAATCLTVGSGTYTATFTNSLFAQQTKDVTIAKLDHNMTHHDAVPATCTEAGTVEYWACSLCGKNYSDANGTTELTSIVDPAKGHSMTHHDAVPATCTEAGTVEYWSCSRCNKNFSDEAGTTELTSLVDPAKGHAMTHHDAVPATCTETGTVEYWSCSRCEKNFSNEAGTTELTDISTPATGHTWGQVSYVWAENYTSVTATRTCQNDSAHVETETAAATGQVTVAPTCKLTGEKLWTSAAFENEAFAIQTTTEILPVDPDAHDWAAATYTWSDDNSTVTAARICRNDASHTETETVGTTYAVITPATDTEAGLGRYTSETFTNPAFTVQTKDVVIQPTGYTITYVWSDDNLKVTATAVPNAQGAATITEIANTTSAVTKDATCTEKGVMTYTAVFENAIFATQTKEVDTPALGHSLEAHAAKDATCTDPGNSAYWECSRCHKYFSDANGNTEIAANSWVIPALEHSWSAPDEVWNADHTLLTVTFTCANGDHPEVLTFSGSDIKVTRVEPTGTTAGSITYTVTYTFNGQNYTAEDVVVLDPLGTYTISGTVTSYTSNHTADADKVVTLVLSKNGTEVARTTVNTTEANYSFNSVEAGTYTLTVSKRDHVTRTYTLNVSAATTQNVVINLLGDVNGDGKVSTIDAALANWHVQGTKPITDAYTLAVADLNGNGEVSTVEVGQINSHARKLAVIWDLY